MSKTSIEWTATRNTDGTISEGHTWNPVTGCTRASAGCDNCYAVVMTRRLAAMGQEKYQGLVNPGKGHFNGVVKTHSSTLGIPLRRKKPTTYFVNSMSDLFHPDVPFSFIDQVNAVMALTPWHTYQILTKRPERMAAYMTREGRQRSIAAAQHVVGVDMPLLDYPGWPLSNVWLGTSVEDQATADERIPHLLRCPAAIRWLSCEPLLGPVVLCGGCACGQSPLYGGHINPDQTGKPCKLQKLDWIVVGGESGSKARKMDASWARSLRKQCAAAGVPFFFKQGSQRNWIRYKDFERFPADLRVRQYPTAHHEPTPSA